MSLDGVILLRYVIKQRKLLTVVSQGENGASHLYHQAPLDLNWLMSIVIISLFKCLFNIWRGDAKLSSHLCALRKNLAFLSSNFNLYIVCYY